MMSDHCVNNNYCKTWSIDQNFDRFVEDHLFKAIDDHQYRFINFFFQLMKMGNPITKSMDRAFYQYISITHNQILTQGLYLTHFEAGHTFHLFINDSMLAQKVDQQYFCRSNAQVLLIPKCTIKGSSWYLLISYDLITSATYKNFFCYSISSMLCQSSFRSYLLFF